MCARTLCFVTLLVSLAPPPNSSSDPLLTPTALSVWYSASVPSSFVLLSPPPASVVSLHDTVGREKTHTVTWFDVQIYMTDTQFRVLNMHVWMCICIYKRVPQMSNPPQSHAHRNCMKLFALTVFQLRAIISFFSLAVFDEGRLFFVRVITSKQLTISFLGENLSDVTCLSLLAESSHQPLY